MHKYEKIQNLYKFDHETKGRLNEFTRSYFEYLYHNDWHCSEKLDGTNLRIIWDSTGDFTIRGRSDRANVHPELRKNIERQLFHAISADERPRDQTWYGEGCGRGIQKNGEKYGEKHFRGFDIFLHSNPSYFLDRNMSFTQFKKMGIPTPVSFTTSLRTAYLTVREGLKSDFGDFFAEGLVCVPAEPIHNPLGGRVIVKIKHRDYYGKELVPVCENPDKSSQ